MGRQSPSHSVDRIFGALRAEKSRTDNAQGRLGLIVVRATQRKTCATQCRGARRGCADRWSDWDAADPKLAEVEVSESLRSLVLLVSIVWSLSCRVQKIIGHRWWRRR